MYPTSHPIAEDVTRQSKSCSRDSEAEIGLAKVYRSETNLLSREPVNTHFTYSELGWRGFLHQADVRAACLRHSQTRPLPREAHRPRNRVLQMSKMSENESRDGSNLLKETRQMTLTERETLRNT